MTATEKFLFDYDFDQPAVNDEHDEENLTEGDGTAEPEPEIIVPTFSEEELNAAREEGFARGKGEGINETLISAEQKTASTLEMIVTKIEDIYQRQDEANMTIAHDAVNVAASITRKLFPQFSTHGAIEEVERVVVSVMEKVVDEPRLTITVNSFLLNGITERLDDMMAETGFEGKVILNGDDALPESDCRIEWGAGTASRDTNSLWQMIDSLIAENTSNEAPADPGPLEGETAQDAVDQEPKAEPLSVADEKTAENRVQSETDISEPANTATPDTPTEPTMEAPMETPGETPEKMPEDLPKITPGTEDQEPQ